MASAPTHSLQSILAELTLEEKISLLAGRSLWETVPVPRLRVPSLKVSDGPNGARGETFKDGTTAACFPCSALLAATWNPGLVYNIGQALAEETLTKGANLLLAPTICPHRHPLGGRNFESFSEDPFLAGKLAVQYVKGLQGKGIGATIKHFVANEQETKRFLMNVNVSQRALREIYLKPFEITVKEADPWAIMTSYNVVNGIHPDMDPFLIKKVLRQEWGFTGLVMSDWCGTNSSFEGINAGLDLEMPGPTTRRKTEAVKAAIEEGKLDEDTIDQRAQALLKLLERTSKFDRPEIPEEQAIDKPEHRALIRETSGQGIVLLKNENNILPLQKKDLTKVAVLGLAKDLLAQGGGSAGVNSHYKVTPWEALEALLGDNVELRYAKGAQTYRALPKWQDNVVDTEGNPGFTLSKYKTQDLTAQPDSVGNYPSADYLDPNERVGAITLDGTFKPQSTGSHYLEAFSLGPSKVLINGEQVSEITKDHDDPMAVLLSAAVGEIFQYKFTADQTYKIRIEALAATGNASGVALLDNLPSIKVGFVPQEDYEVNLVTEAVTAAKDADIAIVFVGNPSDWESEGVDMTTMNLPANGSQDLLISSVASVNPNTIVINFAGVAIAMPWLPQIKSFVQVWFPGQEGGNAIVDILFGNVNPSGKLPVSFPKSLEVTPAYGNFPGDLEKLQVHYKEGIYMGYRHYDLHPEDVLFPFGFGLSYTTFDFSNIKISSALLELKSTINVEIDVTNTGKLAGSEVVQVYVGRKSECSIDVPVKKLAGFAKVFLKPGETKTRSVEFGQDAAAYWHEDRYQWVVEEGDFEIIVATSSAKEDFKQKFDLSVSETFTYGP